MWFSETRHALKAHDIVGTASLLNASTSASLSSNKVELAYPHDCGD
jgi:hypothetical protein